MTVKIASKTHDDPDVNAGVAGARCVAQVLLAGLIGAMSGCVDLSAPRVTTDAGARDAPVDSPGDDDAPPIEAGDAFGIYAISAAGRTGLEPMLAAWWSRLLQFKKATVRRDYSVSLP